MKAIVIFLIISCPIMVFAHPGHGDFERGLLHYFTSWVHVIPIILVLIVIWSIKKLYFEDLSRNRNRNHHA